MLRLQHQLKKQFCQPAIFNKHVWKRRDYNQWLSERNCTKPARQPRHLPILELRRNHYLRWKGKNLKRRVSSYFNREHPNGKTRLLVSKIADIRYIVVKTEEDALLLENNLIKKYKPRYNVLLKDDKTYPSICVSNEYFPRIFKTRQVIRNGSSYYGPYSHMPSMLAVMDLIKSSTPSVPANSI